METVVFGRGITGEWGINRMLHDFIRIKVPFIIKKPMAFQCQRCCEIVGVNSEEEIKLIIEDCKLYEEKQENGE